MNELYTNYLKNRLLTALASPSLHPAPSTMCSHMACFAGCKSEAPVLPETDSSGSLCIFVELTSAEEKTRSRWLFATTCFYFLYPVFLSGVFAVLSMWTQISKFIVYAPLVYAALRLLPMWLIRHCAYRKRGTKLLIHKLPEESFSDCTGIFIFVAGSIDHVLAHGLLRRLQI